jgi:hypothetical protein
MDGGITLRLVREGAGVVCVDKGTRYRGDAIGLGRRGSPDEMRAL